ncbi:unnamed protein product [Boreogadus saida]
MMRKNIYFVSLRPGTSTLVNVALVLSLLLLRNDTLNAKVRLTLRVSARGPLDPELILALNGEVSTLSMHTAALQGCR